MVIWSWENLFWINQWFINFEGKIWWLYKEQRFTKNKAIQSDFKIINRVVQRLGYDYVKGTNSLDFSEALEKALIIPYIKKNIWMDRKKKTEDRYFQIFE